MSMAKGKVGRPKEYKEKYCKMLVDHMAKGKTIKEFAKKIGVSYRTIGKWAQAHPEFMDAKDMGHYKSSMRSGS